ncbi:MAG: DUF4988 and DUF4465 domain-containing protein [Paramuribaculum sp.]|nr:DUF4988 and DUF4465 domain-containing protein [Paramuribaculum sp.]
MNKRILLTGFIAIFAAALLFTSCEYDDTNLWNNVNGLANRVSKLEKAMNTVNSDIKALNIIVESMKNNVTITSVTQTENGYEIKFSDGQTANISNGENGSNAPLISVEKGDDGLYYWTLDGELMLVDGKPVSASSVAPQIRINPDTKTWEISTDGGVTWISTDVKAEGTDGENGDTLFTSVDTSSPEYVVFTLANGTEFKVARYSEQNALFEISGASGIQEFYAGETVTFNVTSENVSDFSISKPDGWTVKYTDNTLTVTAPVAENTYAEKEGVIAINVIASSGKAFIAKINVKVVSGAFRVLTFEDADAKFSPYTLSYCDRRISTWSDLIDANQYGGEMLYGPSKYGMEEPYYWYDQNNTELRHYMPESWGSYCYWGGGHAISNYYDNDLSHGDYMHQLSVYNTTGGHNGSSNFVMHFGYGSDASYSSTSNLPALEFGDGQARVIDHMYVMWSTYLANCVMHGNGLTDPVSPDGYVKVVAVGFDAADNMTGKVELFLASAKGNIMDWTKWNLRPLGAVTKVLFNVAGDSDNGYGFSQPAYFAYDDVAVRFTD